MPIEKAIKKVDEPKNNNLINKAKKLTTPLLMESIARQSMTTKNSSVPRNRYFIFRD